MRPVLARMILAASGRYAIMARADENSPWVQVESVLGADNAARMVDDLENNDADRVVACREGGGDWGEDAPPADAA